jgi:hypothetical protein
MQHFSQQVVFGGDGLDGAPDAGGTSIPERGPSKHVLLAVGFHGLSDKFGGLPVHLLGKSLEIFVHRFRYIDGDGLHTLELMYAFDAVVKVSRPGLRSRFPPLRDPGGG